MKLKLFNFLVWLALVPSAFAGDITGTLVGPTSQPVVNGAMNFTLSQSGVVPGSFAVVANQVACATSIDGTVVGIRNPLVAPTVTPNVASGSVAAGTYYVRISYVTIVMASVDTETLSSPAATAVLGATGKLDITAPTIQPDEADGYRVYVGTVSGSEKLQATVTGFGSTSVTSYNSGAANDPASNDTVCTLVFNDAIIPSYTNYRVSLTNAAGAIYSGFPQNWYLSGSSMDVSNQYPVAGVTDQVRFPTPILANPSSNAQQSVASPVTLNGYSATAGSLILNNNATPPTCGANQAVLYSNASGTLIICENGVMLTGLFEWHDAATDSLLGGQVLIEERSIVNPATGTYLQLYFDSITDAGHIKAYDYTAASAKSLIFDGVTEFDGVANFDAAVDFDGAVDLDSTLNVDGAATFTSTLGVTGNVAVNTNKFNVTAASGNTAVAGTLDVTGAATLSSTLGVTGSATFSGRMLNAKGADVDSSACSSGDCTLGNGNFFIVTGTTTVDGFATSGWVAGSVVVIQTTGNITFNNNGTVAGGFGAMKLVGGANVSMTADDVIQLLWDGAFWSQIAPTLVK